jgi:hypothetical protein
MDAAHPESSLADRLLIRDLVDDWVVSRDAGDWDRFRKVWHEDGWMMATWTQGGFEHFIEMTEAGWKKGVSILHFQGAHSAAIQGDRAIAQTKMSISQRAQVHGVLCDVVCTGRFYDFIERRPKGADRGRWGLVLRQPIYEKDRMDPVDPAAKLSLDPELLARYPEGYRHLAYLQTQIGYPVKDDMPGLWGEKVEALYAHGRRWLSGEIEKPR